MAGCMDLVLDIPVWSDNENEDMVTKLTNSADSSISGASRKSVGLGTAAELWMAQGLCRKYDLMMDGLLMTPRYPGRPRQRQLSAAVRIANRQCEIKKGNKMPLRYKLGDVRRWCKH